MALSEFHPFGIFGRRHIVVQFEPFSPRLKDLKPLTNHSAHEQVTGIPSGFKINFEFCSKTTQ